MGKVRPSKWAHWKREQRRPGNRTGQRCPRCGKRVKGRLDTQHLDGNPSNASPSNRTKLCRSCHTAMDNRAGRHR